MPKPPITAPKAVYCPSCNLSTRPQCERCVHCGKYIICQAQSAGRGNAARKATASARTRRVAANAALAAR